MLINANKASVAGAGGVHKNGGYLLPQAIVLFLNNNNSIQMFVPNLYKTRSSTLQWIRSQIPEYMELLGQRNCPAKTFISRDPSMSYCNDLILDIWPVSGT